MTQASSALEPTEDLVIATPQGLYCPAGDFYIDPWKPVDRAIVTHAHSDHARAGSKQYYASPTGARMLKHRVQKDAAIASLPWREPVTFNDVKVSLHPAGHLLGSAQVRVEHAGRVMVVTGDYKTDTDKTCEPFEVVPCDTFITESTFGLPLYRWTPAEQVYGEINAWWRDNQTKNRTSVIGAYALGKAQRIIGNVDPSIGPIAAHGAVLKFVEAYREAGVSMPEMLPVKKETLPEIKGRALVVAPPSSLGSTWMRKLGSCSTALASGWMQVRGRRRHRAVDRGFVLSDHADWPGLLQTIQATGAKRVGVTHGFTAELARYLIEVHGLDAYEVKTRFVGEQIDPSTEEADSQEA